MDAQTVPAPTPKQKKKGNSFLWLVLLGGCGCLFLICGGCAAVSVWLYNNKDFRSEYCKSLEEQGMKLSEDPLGICN